MLNKIKDKFTPMILRISYGPSRGPDCDGPYYWHCNPSSGEHGGYADTLNAAQNAAEAHARAHPGARAVYEED